MLLPLLAEPLAGNNASYLSSSSLAPASLLAAVARALDLLANPSTLPYLPVEISLSNDDEDRAADAAATAADVVDADETDAVATDAA